MRRNGGDVEQDDGRLPGSAEPQLGQFGPMKRLLWVVPNPERSRWLLFGRANDNPCHKNDNLVIKATNLPPKTTICVPEMT